jgi:hypothetical protein
MKEIKIGAVMAEAKIECHWYLEPDTESDLRASPRYHRIWPREQAEQILLT